MEYQFNIKLALITVAILVSQFAGAQYGGPPGGGGYPGSGSNWQITYDVSGSCNEVTWTRNSGDSAPQSVTANRMVSPPQDPTVPSKGFGASGLTYWPTGATSPTYLKSSLDLKLNIKTKVKWIGAGSPPSEVKLCLYSKSNAVAANGGIAGATSVSNGLGHAEVTVPQTPVFYGYNTFTTSGSSASEGRRYRKFKVSGDSVTIQTSVNCSASGNGQISVSNVFSVSESPFAVSIESDRGETFRRVMKNGVPKRISNFLEDDEVTAKGGDGTIRGDSVLSSPNILNGQDWDFGSRFEMLLLGPWSTQTSGTHKVVPATGYSGGSFSQLSQFFSVQYIVGGKDNNGPSQLIVNDSASASDPVSSISDSCIFMMKAHLPGENKEQVGATFDGFLHRVPASLPGFKIANYQPTPLSSLDLPAYSAGPGKITYTVTGETTKELGWESTMESQASLDAKVVELLFTRQFKITGRISVTVGTSNGAEIVVGPGQAVTLWKVHKGKVSKWNVQRYADTGYSFDSKEFVMDDYIEALTITIAPSGMTPPAP